ncbi:MAG: hypothetical protein LBS55_10960 [Prevotellaceae bacterium]|jgi:hypothetical protein|nr:hypothetical protein [Prevotellaceae bacterium]
MIRKLCILFSFGILSFSVYGQDSLAYKSKWQTKILIGTNIPITKLFQGAETDYLFQYDDNSYYWQILSISYFFHKHWGLEFSYQAGTSSRLRKKSDNNLIIKRADNFIANMQSQYGENYYVDSGTAAQYDDFNFFYGDIGRGFLGVVYRFETNKFYIYPKFAIGLTSFHTDWGSADLKEKNSNIESKVYYSSGKISNDCFTIAPSLSFGYKILNRLYFNVDIMFSYYKTNIVYEKEFTNLYTNESTVKYFDYKKNISTLSFGAGFIFVIR